MPNTFVYAINTKGGFCVYLLLCFCAFVSFVSIVHVFLKRHFLTYSLYELFFRVRSGLPVGVNVRENGAYIHKRHKSLFSPFEAISGCAACTPLATREHPQTQLRKEQT